MCFVTVTSAMVKNREVLLKSTKKQLIKNDREKFSREVDRKFIEIFTFAEKTIKSAQRFKELCAHLFGEDD